MAKQEQKAMETPRSNSRFVKGDLVYLPQDVRLWAMHDSGYNLTKTREPTTAVFIEEKPTGYLLFVRGQRLMAQKIHVYPLLNRSEI
jgi:hypothetical protein